MRKRTRQFLSVTAGFVAAIAISAAVAVADPIEDRQEVMKSNGDSMKVLVAIAKNELPFDPDLVRTNAQTIADGLSKAKELFPEGSESGAKETWAKLEVWAERAVFEQGLTDTVEAARKVAAVGEQPEYMPALADLANGCKGCHDRFTRPK